MWKSPANVFPIFQLGKGLEWANLAGEYQWIYNRQDLKDPSGASTHLA
jgi:hypothetical protein